MISVVLSFAKQESKVEIMPSVHFNSTEYKQIYESLISTKYNRKCPNFRVDDVFCEYESFIRSWNKKKESMKNVVTWNGTIAIYSD